ncbi:saccharopine dehydrogenase family protein [Polymorphum gilvum]|uniref:NAD binding site:UBA/THIF-type NAD/FAD binding fold:Pyridine nucleotide-disulfide oxidoreductase, class I n=1 Tax=Polymorphum gilvum (strain LMG 25793 / CGMCC 1.9160 / SL003B-26A1) TaxID=991905 RepID=F2IX05_POLGS|nr:saccharopine dehydrogenase C-terminal domain-containing protein [Polymorphum gilvum]ADZ71582.1 NAD binding site:UBA/THIF-type NAD/FAD binding fold:Pyridine nucleotide-disulfide oxidoreductase, class I [Polymorphum gilvum SL003B-26A1]
MSPLKITIFGAGNIGSALAVALAADPTFDVEVADGSEQALDRLRGLGCAAKTHALGREEEIHAVLAGRDVAVGAVPETALAQVAAGAARAGVHYLDFSAATARTRGLLEPLARERAVFNGCGVSPGIIGNIACNLLDTFSPVTDLTVRVGAIPRYPTNRLGYGQIWNVDGLIDEYTRPSAAIRDGKVVELTPLEDYERLSIDGVAYEGFVTSGGIEDLAIFSDSMPKNVTVKTLRYPGHLDYMRFLLDDLGLRHRRDMLKSLLYNGLPVIEDDVLLLVVTARGCRGRQPTERTICHRFSPNAACSPFNALTSVAAGYAATLLSMLQAGTIGPRGFVAHHRIDTDRLLASRFIRPLLGAPGDVRPVAG